MAVDVTLNTVASGFNRSIINTNFALIETALLDAISRSGDTPNAMAADLDLNSNDILNVATLNTAILKVAGVVVTDATYVPSWEGPWATSTAYVINDTVREAGTAYICLIAHTSGTFSTDLTAVKWEIFAEKGATGGGTGDMLAANDLSDVDSASTSRSNLGLGTMATQSSSAVAITGGTITGVSVATGWEFVENTYDFSVDGAVATVESANFANNYEYRFEIRDVTCSSSGIWLEVEAYKATDTAYHGDAIRISSQTGIPSDDVWGAFELGSTRLISKMKFLTVFMDEDLNLGASSDGDISITDTSGDDYMKFAAWIMGTAQAIGKLRFSFTGGNLDGGIIAQYRRSI